VITLRFVAHPGPFNALVRFAQYGFWPSHADVLMPDGTLLGSRFIGGVLARPPGYDDGDYLRDQYLRIPATAVQETVFYAFLNRQIGKPYDSLSILAFLSHRDWQAPEAWYCSELPAAALAECGVFPKHLAVQFNRITPRDLFLLAAALQGAG